MCMPSTVTEVKDAAECAGRVARQIIKIDDCPSSQRGHHYSTTYKFPCGERWKVTMEKVKEHGV